MSSGAPGAGSVSQERLSQIALRKLLGLGISARLVPERERVEGELLFKAGKLLHPGTDAVISGSRFVVEGHDRLLLLDPPLAALGGVVFYDLERAAQLEERLAAQMKQRLAALNSLAPQLTRLRLSPKLDPVLLALKAEVSTVAHLFELLATPELVRVVRLKTPRGPAVEVGPSYPPLKLGDFASPVDLEIHLEDGVAAMRAASGAAAPPRAAAPAEAQGVEALAPPAQALTLGKLVEKFGPDAQLSPKVVLELAQDFAVGGQRYRFLAQRSEGGVFQGRLVSQGGERWSDKFDLARFPGTKELVRNVLGIVERPAPAASPTVPSAAAPAHPDHLLPHAGEHWVMNVIVEKETAEEVRYVCTNVEGQPYGAARVLARRDFDAAFIRGATGSSRLLILIDAVEGDTVVYRQCDAQRAPRAQPRRVPVAVLVTTFLPEAAAY